ncbi:MAG TPA: carbohydrate ABC transporter permease [Chloroflexota bacterium]|nr:carbohydrate ABC transporter permease [Chloroflexota bacterium]
MASRTLAAPSARRVPRRRSPANQLLLHAVLLVFAVAALAPFVWMVFGSFKPFRELTTSLDLLPREWTLMNYQAILNRVNFLSAFRNNVVYAGSTTLAVLLTSSLAGYVFAKYRFWGKDLLFAAIISTMMIPFSVVLIPLYVFMAEIGAINTLWGLVLPSVWSAFGIFLLRQFMETIPSELLDAARIDGASEPRIFAQIVLPLTGAPLVALAIVHFLATWDNLLWPSVVLSSPDTQTLPIVLAGLRSLYWNRYDIWMAGSMLTVVPVMAIYAFASGQFIRGVAMTGMKG